MSGEAPAPGRLRAGFAAAVTAGVCLVGPAVLGALGVVLTRNLLIGLGFRPARRVPGGLGAASLGKSKRWP